MTLNANQPIKTFQVTVTNIKFVKKAHIIKSNPIVLTSIQSHRLAMVKCIETYMFFLATYAVLYYYKL